ncbi:Cytochrome P450, family 81, subfamily D, polypeptide 5, putative [Theobroma cacao]|uniref:Cytochrome P450, family 81, subfamily D, polypeptide 5, putative n=1 Tax=Theobroma cacao TaxID=3641 RepID=A0A061DI90_THECC|nr:Cytochrome P450, family 81, subfamily D, polypeptide 5, putative [Theobroma cacao]
MFFIQAISSTPRRISFIQKFPFSVLHHRSMEQTLLCSLASVLFLLVAIRFLLQARKHKNLPPSPFALPILGHLHLLKEPLHRTLFTLSQKHGPIFSLRFGSRLAVVITSPSAVEECFNKNDITLANRPRLIMGKYVGYNYTILALASYGDHWRNLRRLATLEILSSNNLSMSSSIRRDEINSLIRRLYRVSVNGFAKVELKTLFAELTFNIIMRIVAGKRYYGDEVRGSEEARGFRAMIEELFELTVSSYPGDFLPLLSWVDYNGYIKKVKLVAKNADAFTQGLIDEHRRNKGNLELKNTMISHLLTLQKSQPEYYTDEIIKGLVLVMLLAGTDTTAVTLEWAMSNLLNHPRILEKARAELDAQIGQERWVEETDLSKLHYLQNIISETLRLYPAAPLLIPHLASDYCTVGGYDLPPEAIVFVNAWAIQRDPELWEDSTSFKPERFEGREGTTHNKLMPFGLGRRACPGMGLAHRAVGVALGSLIQCFEWEKVSDKEIDMTEGTGVTMRKVEPLEAMCKTRHIINKQLVEVN